MPLEPGATGNAVADLHRRLRAAGVAVGATEPVFDDETVTAVRAFQSERGLRVDGICGQQTWAALVEAGYRLGDRLLYLRNPMLRGDDVAEVQRLLGSLGFAPGRPDGIFGRATHVAAVSFQHNAGLVADGTIGPTTIQALRRLRSRAPESDASALRETALLLSGGLALHSRHVIVAEPGGLAALARESQRAIGEYGAEVTVLAHPDPSAQAEQANAVAADVFVGLDLAEPGAGCRTLFWGANRSVSPAGRYLAELILDELSLAGAGVDAAAVPMNLPVLRETRMPAIVVEVGPTTLAVERAPQVARALSSALFRWVEHPCT